MRQKLGGGSAPFFGRELGPHLTHCHLGRGLPSYQVASWMGHLAAIDMGRKLRGSATFLGRGLVPIYHKVAWAEAYLHAKYHLDLSSRLATINMGRFFGAELPPFGEGSGIPI